MNFDLVGEIMTRLVTFIACKCPCNEIPFLWLDMLYFIY